MHNTVVAVVVFVHNTVVAVVDNDVAAVVVVEQQVVHNDVAAVATIGFLKNGHLLRDSNSKIL